MEDLGAAHPTHHHPVERDGPFPSQIHGAEVGETLPDAVEGDHPRGSFREVPSVEAFALCLIPRPGSAAAASRLRRRPKPVPQPCRRRRGCGLCRVWPWQRLGGQGATGYRWKRWRRCSVIRAPAPHSRMLIGHGPIQKCRESTRPYFCLASGSACCGGDRTPCHGRHGAMICRRAKDGTAWTMAVLGWSVRSQRMSRQTKLSLQMILGIICSSNSRLRRDEAPTRLC